MKLAVVGSRGFNNYPYMKEALDALLFSYWVWTCTIVSGGAKGADNFAERYAREENHRLVVFLPEWEKYGKSAGFRRNELIVEKADMVAAFWDGESKGTKHSITLAELLHKPVYIYKDWVK
jgi:hypothetical protein